MTNRTIIRGDSYALRRPLFLIELADIAGWAFDLTGCHVRTTFKPAADDDVTDATAVIQHEIVIAADGGVTTSTGLVLGEMVDDVFVALPATAGKLVHRLTKAESAAIPVGTAYISDVEVTDADEEVFTFLFEDTLTVVNGVTNRSMA